ncbi:MAG: hypothetical protein DRI84_10550 [Bacteroidetes bacterium]|nr:MAG: hypothetical protein DRI84_10550 [Bacteroidota bacterium]
MKKISLLLIGIFSISLLSAQIQEVWNETYGGTEADEAHSVIETKDGGYLIVGYTESRGSGKKDGWAIKLGQDGSMEWDMTYGGSKDDELFDVIETNTGFAMVGYTSSIGEGKEDFWLVITDKEGRMAWERAYGGKKSDVANKIISSFDGNVYIAGYTKSKGGGGRDFWILKTEPFASEKERGKLIWRKNMGGNGADYSMMIRENLADSFLYVLGNTTSMGNGGMDAILYKLSPDRGSVRAKKNFGGRAFEHGNDFCFTENNGYLIVGGTMTNSKGFFDCWVLKLEEEFYMEWEHTYGGYQEDECLSIVQNKDSYLIAGWTSSKGEGKYDGWMIMLDKKGKTMWEKTVGDVGTDKFYRIIKTSDGHYITVGMTDSRGEGKKDIWVIKFK